MHLLERCSHFGGMFHLKCHVLSSSPYGATLCFFNIFHQKFDHNVISEVVLHLYKGGDVILNQINFENVVQCMFGLLSCQQGFGCRSMIIDV